MSPQLRGALEMVTRRHTQSRSRGMPARGGAREGEREEHKQVRVDTGVGWRPTGKIKAASGGAGKCNCLALIVAPL